MDIKTLIAVATGKIPHNYRSGLCPDELQPDSRDPDCPACKILTEAEAREEREKQEPALYVQVNHFAQAKFSPFLARVCQQPIEGISTLPLYADPPVTAPREDHVTTLRYIAWEAASYMDCVHAAKRAIGEMGALPPPPKIQPTRGEG